MKGGTKVTAAHPQMTDFCLDVMGRYVCNGLDEALGSSDQTIRPDARPFDVIVIGGGSFGPILAQHLFYRDMPHRHRILVLEAGEFLLPEHVQNLPMLGLNPPPPTTLDPGGPRNEVWGLPWRSNVPIGFPGLAYCIGGRSVFFGGWSPQLLPAEMPPGVWSAVVISELQNPLSDGSPSYFRQAAEQTGVTQSNDFIFGALHTALRQRLFDGITSGKVTGAIPLAELPLHLDNVPASKREVSKLEAPLAVQGQPPRPGFFPLNKFSAVPLLMDAARVAEFESAGIDVDKRLMVVPRCHVTRLVTITSAGVTRVTEVLTNQGSVPVPENGVVVIATGTIESTRLALISFPQLPNANLIGRNLMAHMRSNLTIRIPRSALPAGLPNDLQTSALFVKGRHTVSAGVRHFHLQITTAGLDRPGSDSEAQLFKKIPDYDTLNAFRHATDDTIVMTIRGVGELGSQNLDTHVALAGELDEYGLPRAFVTIRPTVDDLALWDAMDKAADDAALVFANGHLYEAQGPSGFTQVPVGYAASQVVPPGQRRDGLGTTHHEAGTLWMGESPTTSVTNPDGRFHFVSNAYVAGPALFPTVGSPNPMLTGTALTRRLGDHLAKRTPPAPDPGFRLLFGGVSTDNWRMSTIRNQPGHDYPGRFVVVNGTLKAEPGTDLGLLWCTDPTPPDFVLRLEWLGWREDDNSGVFIRFPNPDGKGYNNTAFVGVDYGFEVQIDQLAAPDGAAIHKTAAIYNFAGPRDPNNLPVQPPGQWNQFEIGVQGQHYTVMLNGKEVTTFTFKPRSDSQHPDRALPSTSAVPRFIGLQSHTGFVTFRNIQIKAL